MNFYDFEAKTIKGEIVKFDKFKGKTVIVVNTASKCGFTPQFEGLEELYKKHKDKGLEILGFPCNQFMNQDPGSEKEIEEFCQLNYGVTFTMFEKVDVNGKYAHPLFKYLKSELGGFLVSDIKWNFTKFVIDKNGNPIKRYAPVSKPVEMEAYIEQIL